MTMPGGVGHEPGPYDQETDPEPDMWQRVATTVDGTQVLITVWDNDPDTMEVCERPRWAPRWSPPLKVVTPP